MPDETPPSLQNSPPRQPVNPYESSGEALGTSPDIGGGASVERHYQVRLTWADRQMLLRSVLPARIIAVGTVFAFFIELWIYSQSWIDVYDPGAGLEWFPGHIFDLIYNLLWIGAWILSLYVAWVTWLYADRLVQAFGGSSTTLSEWAALHQRLYWYTAMSVVLSLGTTVLYHLLEYFMPRF